jgi:hypothetical protein
MDERRGPTLSFPPMLWTRTLLVSATALLAIACGGSSAETSARTPAPASTVTPCMDKSESLRLRSERLSPGGDLYSDANVRADSRLTSAPSLSGCLSTGTGRRRSCTGGASSTWRPERDAAIPGRFSRLQRRQL